MRLPITMGFSLLENELCKVHSPCLFCSLNSWCLERACHLVNSQKMFFGGMNEHTELWSSGPSNTRLWSSTNSAKSSDKCLPNTPLLMQFLSSPYGILEGVFIAWMWREPDIEKLLSYQGWENVLGSISNYLSEWNVPETGAGNETTGDATWSLPPWPYIHAFPDARPLAWKIPVTPGKCILPPPGCTHLHLPWRHRSLRHWCFPGTLGKLSTC